MDANKQALNDEGRDIWNRKAEFWDNMHGDEGNVFHRTLISPSVERLLALRTNEKVLDVACGSGQLTRRLAALGGAVIGVDFSVALIERAKARLQPEAEPIDYRVVDATDEDALVALGEGTFDAITCTMALMDMPEIDPLFRAVQRLLKVGGRFVFALSHPAFNSNNPVWMVELMDDGGDLKTIYGIKVTDYLEQKIFQGMGSPGEPTPHYYYHRPLYSLLEAGFGAGLVMDGLEEPSFSAADARPSSPLSIHNYQQIPAVIAGRFRRI